MVAAKVSRIEMVVKGIIRVGETNRQTAAHSWEIFTFCSIQKVQGMLDQVVQMNCRGVVVMLGQGKHYRNESLSRVVTLLQNSCAGGK